jgi:hypothetical protein
MVEDLSNKYKTVSSNPSTGKKRKEKMLLFLLWPVLGKCWEHF